MPQVYLLGYLRVIKHHRAEGATWLNRVKEYLNEFCYKVNRRYFGEELFDRLLIACVNINYKNFINDC